MDSAQPAANDIAPQLFVHNESIILSLEQLYIMPNLNLRFDYGDITDLALDLMVNGPLEPLIVYVEDDGSGHHILWGGHRRYAAYQRAKTIAIELISGRWQAVETGEKRTILGEVAGPVHSQFDPARIQCRVLGGKPREIDLYAAQLSASKGKPFTNLEKMLVIRHLTDLGFSKQEIIARTRLSRAQISTGSTLERADRRILEFLKKGILSENSALSILKKFPSAKQMEVVLKAQEQAQKEGRARILPKDLRSRHDSLTWALRAKPATRLMKLVSQAKEVQGVDEGRMEVVYAILRLFEQKASPEEVIEVLKAPGSK